MDLTINYDHTAKKFSESIGIPDERWSEFKRLHIAVMTDDSITTASGSIEWMLSQLKDVQPCDLVMLGFLLG